MTGADKELRGETRLYLTRGTSHKYSAGASSDLGMDKPARDRDSGNYWAQVERHVARGAHRKSSQPFMSGKSPSRRQKTSLRRLE